VPLPASADPFATRTPDDIPTKGEVAAPTASWATVTPPVSAGDSPGTAAFDPTATRSYVPELPLEATANWPEVPGYEVLGELGRGGMGVVYKARHVRLKRLVALKMILAGVQASDEQLARFQSEAEAVARLQHPNIVQVYEIGEHNGLSYFSLEFVDGGSLAEHLHGAPQPPQEAAQMVETLARAVHAAHRRGIIHRDLKPANVLLSSEGISKITDFGLAKQLDVDGGHTQSGAVLGTPNYMAPEQAQGKTKDIGPAADIYALGAILYDLLTGRPPFQGASIWETIAQVVSAEPTRPSRLQPQVPAGLEAICLKCLCKDPQKRYATAEALADDLRHFQEQQTSETARIETPPIGWRGLRRWPLIALGGSLAVLLCLGIGLLIRSTSTDKAVHEESPGRAGTAGEEKPAALSGELILKVWTPGPGGKRGLIVGEDADALPVRKGELVHLEARLNQPAYVYLIWVDSQGQVDPLYPWNRTFKVLPATVSPQTVLHSPPEESRGWPVQGTSGLETAMLLARWTPLPEGTNLTDVVGKLSPSPLRDPQEVAVRGFDSGQPTGTINRVQKRKVGAQAQLIDEPLLQLMDRLRPHFDMIRAVRFAYQCD
jgi:serine/threonine protein kinase